MNNLHADEVALGTELRQLNQGQNPWLFPNVDVITTYDPQAHTPGGDAVTHVTVELNRNIPRSNDDLFELLVIGLKYGIIRYCQNQNLIPRPNMKFGIIIPAQGNRYIPIKKQLHGQNQTFFNYSHLNGNDLTRALNELSSGDTENVTPASIKLMCRFYAYDNNDMMQAIGAGRKRKHAEVVHSADGFCGPQALVLGLAQGNEIKLTDWLRERSKKKLLREAQRLFHELGFRDNPNEVLEPHQRGAMCVADFEEFVQQEHYPTYRVVIWSKIAGVIQTGRKVVFEGSEYGVQGYALGAETAVDHNTIHILYIEEDEHFEYIQKHRVRQLLAEAMATNASHMRWCDYCLTAFPYNTRKQFKEWQEHNCISRDLCEACGEYFQDKARHLKNAEPCPQGCGVMVSKEMHTGSTLQLNEETGEKERVSIQTQPCLKRHLKVCRQNIQCDRCGKEHFEDSQCGKHMCVSCYTGLNKEDVTSHRCFLGRDGKNDRPGEEKTSVFVCKVTAREAGFEDTAAYAAHMESQGLVPITINEGGSRMPDLSAYVSPLTWVFDTECAMKLYPPRSAFTHNRLTLERGEIMEHVPIICGVKNVLSGEQRIWTVWDGYNPMIELLKFVIEQPKGTLMLAHNAARYDNQLVYNAAVSLLGSQILKTSQGSFVMEGCTIKQMQIKNTVFRDTFLHLKQSLAELPKMLGIKDEHFIQKYGSAPKKLFFPYVFCTVDNLDYEGPIPDISYFQVDRKHAKERKEIVDWHTQQVLQNRVWNLKDEYLVYFPMDLNLLAEAVIAYSQFCVDSGFGQPFEHATLPGLAFQVMRRCIPTDSFPILRCFPNLCKPWEYNEFDEWKLCNDTMRGGLTGNFWLYGKADTAAGDRLMGLDYNSHYPGQMFNVPMPSGNYTFTHFCEATQPTLEDLEAVEGAIVCEIEPTRAVAHPPLHRIINGRLCFPLLACRTKTDAIHVQQHCFNQKLNSVCSNQCAVCAAYWKSQPQPYTIMEVKHAVKKYGYRIRYVYCMLYTNDVRTDMFKEFIGRTYGQKAKFSKPPCLNWTDPHVCADYVRGMKEHAYIDIPPEFHSHPQDWHTPEDSMKAMSKLVPNSAYGRTAMSPFKESVELVEADYVKEQKFMADHGNNIVGEPSHHATHTLYKLKSRLPNSTLGKTNVLIGSYITAGARLMIIDDMNFAVEHGCKVVYGDTDSMFFVKPLGATAPPTGIFLGQLENDMKSEWGTPEEIVAVLPKSYAIRNTEGRVVKMRFKGVSGVAGSGGDARNCAILDFEWMKGCAMAMKDGKPTTSVVVHHRQAGWKRNRLEPSIEWQDSWKVARAERSMLKGRLAKSGRIFPFGAENFDWGEEIEWVDI